MRHRNSLGNVVEVYWTLRRQCIAYDVATHPIIHVFLYSSDVCIKLKLCFTLYILQDSECLVLFYDIENCFYNMLEVKGLLPINNFIYVDREFQWITHNQASSTHKYLCDIKWFSMGSTEDFTST